LPPLAVGTQFVKLHRRVLLRSAHSSVNCAFHFFPSFRGRPPRSPFFRAAAAFAFDVTELPFCPISARYFLPASFIAEPH
jgi:hypothetical protein